MDKFEIYGGLHVIFSNIMLSVLFKIKHNIKTTTYYYYYYYFKTVLHCYLFADIYCTFFILFMFTYPVQSLQEIVKKTTGCYATDIITLLIGQILP
jgi:hypothetical protein